MIEKLPQLKESIDKIKTENSNLRDQNESNKTAISKEKEQIKSNKWEGWNE